MKKLLSILVLCIALKAISQPVTKADGKLHNYNYDSTIVKSNEITVVSDTVTYKAGIAVIGTQMYFGTGFYWIATGINSVAWSTITGTPTTLSGYGITDAYTKTQVDGYVNPKMDSVRVKNYVSWNYQPIGSYALQSTTLTINGTSYDLSTNRSWTINSMVYPGAGIAVSTGSAWTTSITDNSSNWNTVTAKMDSVRVKNWTNWNFQPLLGYTAANAATTLAINGTGYDLSTNRSWTISLSSLGGEPTITAPYTTNKYWNGYKVFAALNTDSVAEGSTNKFYTDARARAAHSFTAGSGAYNSSTGVITIPTNTNQLTNGANFITLTSLSSTVTAITYTNTTGVFSLTSGYQIPTTTQVSNWNALTTMTYPGVGIAVSTGTAWGTSITDNSTAWNTVSAKMDSVRVKNWGNWTFQPLGSYLTANQTITLSGVVTGSGTTAITTSIAAGVITNTMLANGAVANLSGTNTGDNAVNSLYSGLVTNATHTGDATGATVLTLATVNSNIGTFNNVTVNAKGLVTSASNTSYLTANQTITLSGDVSGSGTTAITTTIGASKVTNAMLAGSIAASKLVGTDITTVGTITSGVWQGTAIADSYISSASTWNGKQTQINGTGFVKASGTTISYDNSTYLTTTTAASTYVPYSNATGTVNLNAQSLQNISASSGSSALSFQDINGIKIQLNGSGGSSSNYYSIEKQNAISGGDALFKFQSGNVAGGEFGFYSQGSLRFFIASTGASTFSSTIRSSDTYGFAMGALNSVPRIQYGSSSSTGFSVITGANNLADFYANAATFASTVTASGIINANNGVQMNAQVLAFNQSGTRSWNVQATGGHLAVSSGDNVGDFNIGMTTASTSYTTGALVVGGGVGVAGALFVNSTGNFAGYLTASGGAGTSDIRLKTNIVYNPSISILDSIDFIQYNMKDNLNRLRYGNIAQQVEKYYPDLVLTNDKGIKAIMYDDLQNIEIHELHESIKELKAEILELKKHIK